MNYEKPREMRKKIAFLSSHRLSGRWGVLLLTLAILTALWLPSLLIPARSQVTSTTAYRIRKGAATPAACAVGDVFVTTGTVHQYLCTAVNTWTQVDGGGGGSPGGSSGQIQFNNAGAFGGVAGSANSAGAITWAATARTSGVAPYYQITAPTDTGLTASTEAIGINYVGATRQHATGAITTQREVVFGAPTYSFVGASTITDAATVAIAGNPVQGTNATLTNSSALLMQNGAVAKFNDAASQFFQLFAGADAASTGTFNVRTSYAGHAQFHFANFNASGSASLVLQKPSAVGGSRFFITWAGSAVSNVELDTEGNHHITFRTSDNIQFTAPHTETGTIYIGSGGDGVTHTSAGNGTIRGVGGSGTNNAGANLFITGGAGTGNAVPGLVSLKYPLVGASGTTLQSLSSNSYPVQSIVFVATADATVANTTTETTILGTGTGTKTIEAGLLRVARVVRITVRGFLANTGTPTLQFRVKYGSTTLLNSGATTQSVTAQRGFVLQADITTRTLGASGTVYPQGMLLDSGGGVGIGPLFATATSTIDTTASQVIDVTAQWGTANAANTITATSVVIEYLD